MPTKGICLTNITTGLESSVKKIQTAKLFILFWRFFGNHCDNAHTTAAVLSNVISHCHITFATLGI